MNSISKLEANIGKSKTCQRIIRRLNVNELKDLNSQIYAFLSWHKGTSAMYRQFTRCDIAAMNRIWKQVKKRLKTGRALPETTEFGSLVDREHVGYTASIHEFTRSSELSETDWVALYSDGGYAGAWVNYSTLTVCEYSEGDVAYIRSPDTFTLENEVNRVTLWSQRTA